MTHSSDRGNLFLNASLILRLIWLSVLWIRLMKDVDSDKRATAKFVFCRISRSLFVFRGMLEENLKTDRANGDSVSATAVWLIRANLCFWAGTQYMRNQIGNPAMNRETWTMDRLLFNGFSLSPTP